MDYIKIKNYKDVCFVLYFICLVLFFYGQLRGIDLFIAPIFCFLSFTVAFQNQSKPLGLVRVLMYFSFVSFLSSYNFWLYNSPRGNYIEYFFFPATSFFSAYAMYSYVCQNNNENLIKFLFFFLFLFGIYKYFHSESIRIVDFLRQNNYFYYVLYPLPFLVLKPQSKIALFSLITSSFICLLSIKRSALIAVFLIWFAYIVYFSFFYSWNKSWIRKFFLCLVLVVCALNVSTNELFNERYDQMYKRFESLDTDRGSGRGELIDRFFDKDVYDVTRFPEILIGNGFESYGNKYDLKVIALHNDFCEVLYSYGFFGFFLYLVFIGLLIKRCFVLFVEKNDYFLSATICLILFVVYGLFANNFYFFCYSSILFSFIGFLEGTKNKSTLVLIQCNHN